MNRYWAQITATVALLMVVGPRLAHAAARVNQIEWASYFKNGGDAADAARRACEDARRSCGNLHTCFADSRKVVSNHSICDSDCPAPGETSVEGRCSGRVSCDVECVPLATDRPGTRVEALMANADSTIDIWAESLGGYAITTVHVRNKSGIPVQVDLLGVAFVPDGEQQRIGLIGKVIIDVAAWGEAQLNVPSRCLDHHRPGPAGGQRMSMIQRAIPGFLNFDLVNGASQQAIWNITDNEDGRHEYESGVWKRLDPRPPLSVKQRESSERYWLREAEFGRRQADLRPADQRSVEAEQPVEREERWQARKEQAEAMNRQMADLQERQLQIGAELAAGSHNAEGAGNAPHLAVMASTMFGNLSGLNLGGLGIGGVIGFYPLNTPDWRLGAIVDGGYMYYFFTSSSSEMYELDARLQLSALGQHLRLDAGYYAYGGSHSTTSMEDESTETRSASAQGYLFGARVGACIEHAGERCGGWWYFGVDRFLSPSSAHPDQLGKAFWAPTTELVGGPGRLSLSIWTGVGGHDIGVLFKVAIGLAKDYD
jgi:hypothetical protein